MALAELAEKGADVDVLRQMVQFMAQRLMEIDVEGRCGAGYGEKSAERINSRNGFRDRTWETRAGSVELKLPKLRQGSSFPEFLEPRRTAEKALTAVIQEAHIKGISTRSVDDLVKAVGMSGVSKSQVFRLCAELDERVGAFPNRQIEGDWPYLWIDGTYVKTREAGRIVSVAVVMAVGVNTEGQREVLGIKAAAAKTLKAATWQRCRVHFMRNVLAYANKTQRRMVSAAIGTVFVQETPEAARTQWRSVADQFREKLPKLSAMMDEAENDVLAFMGSASHGRTGRRSAAPTGWRGSTPRSSAGPTSWASSPTTTPSHGWSAPRCWSRTTSGVCPGATCSSMASKLSVTLSRLGCPQWHAEHPAHPSLSGLWTYTTRRDITNR